MNRAPHILKAAASLLLLSAVLISPELGAQQRRRGEEHRYGVQQEKKVRELDSLEIARRDSLHRVDSLHKIDSVALLGKSSLEQPAFSTARDSIVEVFSDGHRLIYYYGDVTVTYQDMKLTAELMEFDMNTSVVYAKGVYDTLSGEWKGRPVMQQGKKTYNMQEVKYNFNTRKSYITNLITNEDDGILHGSHVKMMPDQSINMTKGKYTVCDADHPHYWLELELAKVMTKPSQKTVFGPAHLVVEDVHLPFVGLPFGFIPKRPDRATGMLMPTFGEEQSRGFYLKDAGMYFVFGDYLDLSVTGDIYSLGSWALDVNSRYKINYKCSGGFTFNYSNDQTGEKGTPEFFQSSNFGVKWNHSQDSKAHPGTSFSASVNFSSPSNSKYNSHSVSEALQNQISSSVSWSHNWNGKFNLSINGLHSQNSRDSSYTFTLPNISFSMSTIYPFKRKNRVGKERAYEKISIGYNTSFQNKISFKASEFDLSNPDFLDKFSNGMAHNFSIGLPNFQLFKYISVNPSVSYSQNWFFRAADYAYNPDTGKVEQQKSSAFNHFGITQNYSGSLSASTRIYGTFNFGSYHKIQAIRHVISPSLSMSFSPEKGTYANGYRTLYYTDATGADKEYQYNIYSGQMYSAPGKGRSATASLSIGNNIEAKVRDYADTTGKGSKKVKLIDQLSFNTSYNFLADSMKMSTVSASMSTNLFNKINISASAGFDPYAINEKGTRYNQFAIMRGQGLARLTNASISASYSISGKGAINGNDGTGAASGDSGGSSSPSSRGSGTQGAASYYQRIYYHPITGEYIPGGWVYYSNPNVPWSLSFSGQVSYNRSYRYDTVNSELKRTDRYTATLSCNGNLKLTPKMNITMSSGYDFVAGEITTTQISATYDLHCFNISVSWVPTGTWKSYSFRIAANASALADILRFKKSDSYWDN